MSDDHLAQMQTSAPFSSTYYPTYYPAVPANAPALLTDHHPFTDSRFLVPGSAPSDGCSAIAQLALLGAVIGGSAAAGANIRRLQRAEVDTVDALADTARAALATAAASAVAGAAASAVRQQGLLRLGVLFASGTAVMYGIQRYLERGTDA
ncbi:hypothetical protein CKO42_03440 [Lamprobacter modestohalophilus]|uniref:Uncharacterized protein n=1 Tax=Lamprobacter modestohalophilus TaxID=1064514 RepID=A0A9X1B2M5_9GAMM|nr:magnetosome protein MamC [Lamprobacter modestohalophilus]MBK1617520.1 hypothetical protein [Lamprobacter modestohalophilus]